jgi:DNA (cytosine-5)-methyltransferase 1
LNEPTHVDLFSGIGGFALAAQWAGFRTIAFCEIDKYCRKVLAKNFPNSSGIRRLQRDEVEEGQQSSERREAFNEFDAFDSVRIHSNIFDFDGTKYRGCDLLTGGFPCQPFSVAGKRRGTADDRALWPQMFRVISEARPAWVLGENVPGIIPMELDNVLSDLDGIGYATRPFVIPACAVDARHRRDRVWIVAKSETERFQGQWPSGQQESYPHGQAGLSMCEGAVPADSDREPQRWPAIARSERCEWLPEPDVRGVVNGLSPKLDGALNEQIGANQCEQALAWPEEPSTPRVATGVKNRVDRLKGLGNAIVPQVAYEILKGIYDMIKRE